MSGRHHIKWPQHRVLKYMLQFYLAIFNTEDCPEPFNNDHLRKHISQHFQTLLQKTNKLSYIYFVYIVIQRKSVNSTLHFCFKVHYTILWFL